MVEGNEPFRIFLLRPAVKRRDDCTLVVIVEDGHKPCGVFVPAEERRHERIIVTIVEREQPFGIVYLGSSIQWCG